VAGRLRLIGSNPPAGDDLRFRKLLSDEAWSGLPSGIRARFSKRLGAGSSAVFVGEVTACWLSSAGWWLAQSARAIGAPLPLCADTAAPITVTVTEDNASRGQIWTRLYARRDGLPQIIHSVKRFAGPTGLEEYIGRGIGIALTVHVESEALVFRSRSYFLQVFGRRVPLPTWITPGELAVTHAEAGDGSFVFTLEITHSRSGPLLRLAALFREFQR
jgi:hypothetical protein